MPKGCKALDAALGMRAQNSLLGRGLGTAVACQARVVRGEVSPHNVGDPVAFVLLAKAVEAAWCIHGAVERPVPVMDETVGLIFDVVLLDVVQLTRGIEHKSRGGYLAQNNDDEKRPIKEQKIPSLFGFLERKAHKAKHSDEKQRAAASQRNLNRKRSTLVAVASKQLFKVLFVVERPRGCYDRPNRK